jgi:hypothetical protein
MRALFVVSVLLAACNEGLVAEPPPDDVAPRHASAATIPDGPVRGTVGGEPFEAKRAYYRIYRQRDREHLDIMLLSEPGDCDDVDSPSVWIRFAEPNEPARGELRRGARDDAPWSVHYQVKRQGRWLGHAGAAALLAIDNVKGGSFVDGDVSACFADASRSCIDGHFHADRCLDPVSPDVRDLRPD